MAKRDLYVIRPTRFDGERAEPGMKVTVSEEEAVTLLASNRFSVDPPSKPEKGKKEETPKP